MTIPINPPHLRHHRLLNGETTCNGGNSSCVNLTNLTIFTGKGTIVDPTACKIDQVRLKTYMGHRRMGPLVDCNIKKITTICSANYHVLEKIS